MKQRHILDEEIQLVIYGLFEVIDYQLSIMKREGKECLEFKVEVTEEGKGLREETERRLLATPVIGKNLSLGKMAEPEVEMVSPGSLQRRTRAKKLIIENRGHIAG